MSSIFSSFLQFAFSSTLPCHNLVPIYFRSLVAMAIQRLLSCSTLVLHPSSHLPAAVVFLPSSTNFVASLLQRPQGLLKQIRYEFATLTNPSSPLNLANSSPVTSPSTFALSSSIATNAPPTAETNGPVLVQMARDGEGMLNEVVEVVERFGRRGG